LLGAAEHAVEPLAEPAPAEELSPEIAAQIAGQGLKVVRGTRTVCEIWPCKEWAINAQPTGDILYPFQPGQLIGVVRFPRRGSDFRDQTIATGVYTMRYAHQPVDGNHVGTSLTRDFLLLVQPAVDRSAGPMDVDELMNASTEVAEGTHPALLALKKSPEAAAGAGPAIRHMEEEDFWVVRFSGQTKTSGEAKELFLEVVVVGHASE
jgi:hypothetical protein